MNTILKISSALERRALKCDRRARKRGKGEKGRGEERFLKAYRQIVEKQGKKEDILGLEETYMGQEKNMKLTK